ncbi:protein EARLY FLOWERING 4-like [Papaver somniferum]|uniref:protein EARLY FLOWERING 4-like n=1 Tax=Papaver somniferum TaxID=3469 RepID=UPI000E6F7E13|nr:protein EARLY FLOWERING 4-like [Papaver somniferum]
MTTVANFSSGAEQSSMDYDADDQVEIGEEEEEESEVWKTISKSFQQVQAILDQNRILIQQVNENHQSKIPQNLAKNVALIRDININVSKVASIYTELSTNFSGFFHQSRGEMKNQVEYAADATTTDGCGIHIFMFYPQM